MDRSEHGDREAKVEWTGEMTGEGEIKRGEEIVILEGGGAQVTNGFYLKGILTS